jgi:hypothetical protein
MEEEKCHLLEMVEGHVDILGGFQEKVLFKEIKLVSETAHAEDRYDVWVNGDPPRFKSGMEASNFDVNFSMVLDTCSRYIRDIMLV